MSDQIMSIGSRLEWFVDDVMVESLTGGARRVLHHPRPREVVLIHDRPWEGNTCCYHSFFHDDAVIRAYYRGSQNNPRLGGGPNNPAVVCTAESHNGIHWRRPVVRQFAMQGSLMNNIVHKGYGAHNFSPFKDARPDCPPEQRYKALAGRHKLGLFAFFSADGLEWRPAAETGVITDGRFDSQNIAFWDERCGVYRAYYRDFKGRRQEGHGVRDIKLATSPDFIHWSKGEWLEYPGSPKENLYTNQIQPYPRAPHLYVGFPSRYCHDRGQIVEGLLMSSRDGCSFQRWGEAFLRPGLNRERWGNRCNYIWRGLIETPADEPGAPNELSLYSSENYYESHTSRVRRFSIRMDGFVSVNAPLAGGELVTRPFIFQGCALLVNAATSAAGSLRLELQAPDGRPVKGFELDACPEMWGDAVEWRVSWEGAPDLGALAGRPVRMRAVLHDADLYSFRFGE